MSSVVSPEWFSANFDTPEEGAYRFELYKGKVEFYLRAQQMQREPPC